MLAPRLLFSGGALRRRRWRRWWSAAARGGGRRPWERKRWKEERRCACASSRRSVPLFFSLFCVLLWFPFVRCAAATAAGNARALSNRQRATLRRPPSRAFFTAGVFPSFLSLFSRLCCLREKCAGRGTGACAAVLDGFLPLRCLERAVVLATQRGHAEGSRSPTCSFFFPFFPFLPRLPKHPVLYLSASLSLPLQVTQRHFYPHRTVPDVPLSPPSHFFFRAFPFPTAP